MRNNLRFIVQIFWKIYSYLKKNGIIQFSYLYRCYSKDIFKEDYSIACEKT